MRIAIVGGPHTGKTTAARAVALATGLPLSVAFLFAVWVSNIPQALAPSVDLANAGWSKGKMTAVWGSVVVACGLAAALGYLAATNFSDASGARLAALAAGGLLAMLTDSLIPFAFERGGKWAGLGTVMHASCRRNCSTG